MTLAGLPHSEIPGSKPVGGSPRLIAASHVLHRLLAPRHPPFALSSLTIILVPAAHDGTFAPPLALLDLSASFNAHIQLSKSLLRAAETCRLEAHGSGLPGGKPTTLRFGLVELIGIEPTTSWLQTRRSPS